MATSKEVQGTVALDLGALLDAGDGAIVMLVSGDTRLVVHRAVLEARSPVFAAMFAHDTLEASSGQVTIHDVEGPVLRQLLGYMYTLQAPQLPGMAPQLLAAAEKYGLLGLKTQCEQQLSSQLTVENAAATAVIAVRHSCGSLKEAALTFIKTRGFEVMATEGWAHAMREQTEDLIEVSRLLYDQTAENRAPDTTGSSTITSATTGASCQPHSRTPATAAQPTPPADGAAVAQLRSLSSEERSSRLIHAACEGAVDELTALLAAGVDMEARGGWERTALHWAALEGHVQAVQCLLEAGAQVDARGRWQTTPLHSAARCGHAAVVRLLLAWSADPNPRDNRRMTPLHNAVENGSAEVVAALLEAGADRGASNKWGKTPWDLARQESKWPLMQMLS